MSPSSKLPSSELEAGGNGLSSEGSQRDTLPPQEDILFTSGSPWLVFDVEAGGQPGGSPAASATLSSLGTVSAVQLWPHLWEMSSSLTRGCCCHWLLCSRLPQDSRISTWGEAIASGKGAGLLALGSSGLEVAPALVLLVLYCPLSFSQGRHGCSLCSPWMLFTLSVAQPPSTNYQASTLNYSQTQCWRMLYQTMNAQDAAGSNRSWASKPGDLNQRTHSKLPR